MSASEEPIEPKPAPEPAAPTQPAPAPDPRDLHKPSPKDEPEPAREDKPVSPLMLGVIGAAIVLALFAMQVWSSGNRVRQAQRQGITRTVDSLAASLRQYMLDRNPDRTRRALVDIAQAGKFEEVTLTDPAGNVLASTERTKERKSIHLPGKPALEAQVTVADGRMTVLKAVVVGGDNVMGNLRVVARDGE